MPSAGHYHQRKGEEILHGHSLPMFWRLPFRREVIFNSKHHPYWQNPPIIKILPATPHVTFLLTTITVIPQNPFFLYIAPHGRALPSAGCGSENQYHTLELWLAFPEFSLVYKVRCWQRTKQSLFFLHNPKCAKRLNTMTWSNKVEEECYRTHSKHIIILLSSLRGRLWLGEVTAQILVHCSWKDCY